MAEPTEADRERAAEIAREVAAALADERERARAPFLALADDLDRETAFETENPREFRLIAGGYRAAATRIRRAAEETGQ
jgi:hypothetical protein